ncbi:M20/M25/M40 family metallo-hydrolase [Paracoccus cavernae]|uniref:M20/M25/M40 family metallo-hydrolase n=1 Tax=Paracoccus cavernae TaxID=1571207 RepID=A0ABT8DAW6_9RHOB|nr:M20/M25/M40 family metallo-hydrolase [Paracoccus cavernae]
MHHRRADRHENRLGPQGKGGLSRLLPRPRGAFGLALARSTRSIWARFVQALEQRQEALAATGPRDDDYDIPYSTIHAGVMRGGTALNIVPNLCEVDFEIRNIAEDDPETILAGIRADAETIAAPYRATFPEARITIDPVTAYPGLATPEDGAALALLRRITGRNDPAIKVAFGTEGGLFAQGLGISTAICGPGFMDQGHRPDEFVALDQLAECSRVLDNLLFSPRLSKRGFWPCGPVLCPRGKGRRPEFSCERMRQW